MTADAFDVTDPLRRAGTAREQRQGQRGRSAGEDAGRSHRRRAHRPAAAATAASAGSTIASASWCTARAYIWDRL